MRKTYLAAGPAQTKKLGERLSKKILKIGPKKSAFVIGLMGNLGGGKTTFLQGFTRGLGIKEKILSPTFIIFRKYKIPAWPAGRQNTKYKIQNLYHFDCYRIKKPKEILDLGFKKIIQNPKDIVAIEWADRIKKIMPENTLWVKFKFINSKTRKIQFVVR